MENPEARPGADAETTPLEMPRWSAERRAGQRHWPVIPGDPGIGPTARRATGCGVPHQRLPALCPPRMVRGERDWTNLGRKNAPRERWSLAE